MLQTQFVFRLVLVAEIAPVPANDVKEIPKVICSPARAMLVRLVLRQFGRPETEELLASGS